MKRSIEERLVGMGNLIGAAQRKGVSLSGAERRMQERLHTEAIHEHGYSWTGINGLEMEGERGRRGSMPWPIESRFIGVQKGGLFGLGFRMYNVEGDHVLNNSTVGVSTLMREHIHIGDLSLIGVWREVAKEQFVMLAWTTLSSWERLWAILGKEVVNARRLRHVLPVALVSLALFATLSWLVARGAVNAVFWDEWDYLNFDGAGPVAVFTHQHGPHRLGLGGVLIDQMNAMTAWDSRAISWAALGLITTAFVLCLWIRIRTFGGLDRTDVAIAASMLCLAQTETMVGNASFAQLAVPLVLLMICCLLISSPMTERTMAILAGVYFCLIYSGYGVVFAPAVSLVLVADMVSRAPALERRAAICLLLAQGISIGSFFNGYVFSVVSHDHAQFGQAAIGSYLAGFGSMLVGLDRTPLRSAAGFIYLGAVVAVFVGAMIRIRSTSSARDRVVAILSGAALSYFGASLIGRASLGVTAHYMTVAGLGGVAIHLDALRLRPRIRTLISALVAIGCLSGSVVYVQGRRGPVEAMNANRRNWSTCYRQTMNEAACTAQYAPGVYPYPAATGLDQKLQFLRDNHLNMFDDKELTHAR